MTKSLKASLRKGIVSIVMMTTIFSLSGVAALIPVAQAAAIVDGDVIRNPSAAGDAQFDVYIVKLMGANKYKRLVLNPAVFASYGHLKWENVKLVTSEEMNPYKTSAMVRVETDPKVMALAPNGDVGSKSWLNVSAETYVAAGGTWDQVYTINAVDGANYAAATDLTTSAQVVTFLTTGVLPGGVPPVVGLNVSLSADTPASGTLISGTATAQSGADLMHFTLTGTGTVTGVALKRIGVSDDATLSNVYLFDGATRITDAASVSTGGVISFNNSSGLFTVSGTKTISVKSDLASNKAGQTVGVQLTGVTMTTGVVGGVLPVSGNLMSVASATLAAVALSVSTGSGASDPANGLLVWQSTAIVGTRDVLLTRLALRQVGSIVSTDINNFKLLVDGTEVATTASLDSNGYATFVLSKALATGGRVLKVTADVIGGSGRTVQLSLRGAYDISATDTSYGVGITATGTFPNNPTAFTVNSGSMTVVKSTASRSTNLTVGASDQSLATYTFTAFGEPIKVETLKVGILGTTSGTITDVTIQDVKIMVNGAQVGSTTPVPAATAYLTNTGTQFTTNFTVAPGTPATVEIRGNMVDTEDNGADNDDISAGTLTAVQAVLVGGTDINNGVPQVTITAVDVPTDTNVLGNSLTISSGSISIAKTSNYGNQTIVTPQAAYKIGSFVVTGNATEAVNLNTIYVGFTAGSTATEATDLSSLYVTYGATSTTPKGTVSATILNGNSWSISQTLAVNQTMTFDVYSSIATSLSTNAIISTLAVAGTTALSGITVYADSVADTALDAGFTGQTITGGTGSITAILDGSSPPSALVDDAITITTAAYKFSASNDSYTITDLRLSFGDATSIATVALADVNGTPIPGVSLPGGTPVNFHGLSVVVPANGSTVIKVQLTLGTVGSGAGITGGALTTTLVGASTSVRSSGGTVSTLTASGSIDGNAMYVYKSYPVITAVALPTTLLTAGSSVQTLSKFTIASTGGPIGWQQIAFTVAKNVSGTDTLASPTLWDVTAGGSGTQVTTTGSYFTGSVNVDNDTAGGIVMIATTEQTVSGSKTYELRATVGGTATINDTLITNIAAVSSYASAKKAFAYYSPTATSFSLVSDVDADGTITAGDIRETANSSVVAAQDATTAISTAVNNVRGSYGLTNAADNGLTVIVTGAVAAGNDTLASITGTLESSGGFTCTAYTAVDGGGSAITEVTGEIGLIRSIKCTATGKQVMFNVTGVTEAQANVNTITLTVTDNAYTVGLAAAANNSDLNTVLTAGVPAAASFVWSDQSAASHANTTTDWASDALVLNIPTATNPGGTLLK